jgi:hypothetical protein
MRTVLSVLIAVLAAAPGIAAIPPAERVAATPIPEAATAIRVDGELNDAVWRTVPAITGFRQRDPKEGAPPTFETEARIAFDATALYIAVQPFDPEPTLVNGRSKSYDGRYAPFAYAENPDFNYRSFRTTNVLRWEYKPGSTLFAVWQQGREDTLEHGSFDFSQDFGGVFSAPSRNVFLIKWAYWLNY